MKSKESQVATQVRLNQWAIQVQDCLNRPKNMTVDEWCCIIKVDTLFSRILI